MPTLLLLLAFVRAADGPGPSARVDGRIFAGSGEGAHSSYLVVLREQADLSGAAKIRDRRARRQFVYETLRAHADASQASLRQRLESAGVPYRPHFLVNMIEVEGEWGLASELAADEGVLGVEANLPGRLERPHDARVRPRAATPGGVEPNIQRIQVPYLWDRGFTGQGVVIGSADTGFQWDHAALKNQYRGWNGSAVSHDYNWHDAIHDAATGNVCGSDAPAPCDDHGHGTETSGLAVGDDGAGNRVGVAPGARLIGCRNMEYGTGTPARYTECFEWFLAPTDSNGANPRPDLGADVINNSWVCPVSEGCTDPDILRAVVENVRAAGIAVVAAAGNDGFACGNVHDAPAIYDACFTVGATDNDDRVTGFSSVGPVVVDGSNRLKPDLVAPGVDVRTAVVGGGYSGGFSGTSAAAPHVAGGIALLWSAVPELAGEVDDTERLLEATATPLPSPTLNLVYNPEERIRFCGGYDGLVVPNPVFGWGRLNVGAAYFRLLHPFLPRGAPIPNERHSPAPRVAPIRP